MKWVKKSAFDSQLFTVKDQRKGVEQLEKPQAVFILGSPFRNAFGR